MINIRDLANRKREYSSTGDEWLIAADAAKKLDVNVNQIHSCRYNGFVPDYMRKEGNNWVVNINSIRFKEFLASKVKKSIKAEKGHLKRNLTESEEEQGYLEELKRLSIEADLKKPIKSLELDTYKAEEAKIKLKKKSGELIDRQLAEFLYIGYLERLNMEMLQYQNKLEPKIEQLVSNLMSQIKDGDETDPKVFTKKITSLIAQETEEVIKTVKEAQQKDLKKWAEDESIEI